MSTTITFFNPIVNEILEGPLVTAFFERNRRAAIHLVFAALQSLNGEAEWSLFWKVAFALEKADIVEGFFLEEMKIPGGKRVYEMPVEAENGKDVCLGRGPSVLRQKVSISKYGHTESHSSIRFGKAIRVFFPYDGDEKYPMGHYFRVYIEMEGEKTLSFLVDPDGNYLPPYLVPISNGSAVEGYDEVPSLKHDGLTANFEVMLLNQKFSGNYYWRD